MNTFRSCTNTIAQLNSDDQQKCKKLAFLAIFAGIFIEPAMIVFLLHFWFNDKEILGKSFYPHPVGLKEPHMGLVVNLVCRCENITVAQKNAEDINAILSFLSVFRSDGVIVSNVSLYMKKILGVPVETAKEKVYSEIKLLDKEKKEWDDIRKITGMCDISTSEIRKTQISELKKIIQILDILKHLKPLKTPTDLVALVKVMFLHSVADVKQRDDSQDEHIIQQIVRALMENGIIPFLDKFQENTPEATPAERLVRISKFFGKLEEIILDKIYSFSPEIGFRRLSLLGYCLESRFRPHLFTGLPCPPQFNEFSKLQDFLMGLFS